MRKITTLLFALVALCASAQISQSDIATHLRKVDRSTLPARHFTMDPNRSTSNIAIDYDSFDIKWMTQNTPPDSMYTYSWNINKNNLNTSTLSLRYVTQSYDTLIDVNNNFAGTARAGTTVRVDSFDIYLAHENLSGGEDTVIISVYDKNAASTTVTGAGAASKLNTTPIWSDTIYTDQNLFPNATNFFGVTFKPNVTLPAGHTFGIRVDFAGDTLDQLYVLASYRDKCSSAGLGDTNKIAPRNSSFYLNNAGGSGFYNYTTNLAFNVPNACKYFFIQNFLIYPYVTLSRVDPATVVTTAATNVASTTATINGTVNANGDATAVSFEWGLTTSYGNTATGTPSNVTGSTSTAVSANLSSLVANTTYHYRAKGVNGGGPVYGSDLTFTTLAAGTVCTPDPNITSGLGPVSSSVPCVEQGVAFSQTYTFAIPATLLGGQVTVTSVTFDSIRNLPTPFTADFSQTPATYTGGSTGCMLVSGTTNAACGQYQMLVYVTIVTNALTVSGELSALAAQYSIPNFPKNFIRVIAQGGTCPAVNANQTTPFASGSCGLAPTITASATGTNVNCFGASTGTASATPTGGSTYTYVWSNGAQTQAITGLAAGVYTVTVTDAGGGTATASYTVTQPAAAVSVTGSATNATSGNNGAVNITPAGGTGTYTYNWSNSAQTQDLTGLGAGSYSVTVTDQNGCTATASYTVTSTVGIVGLDLVSNLNVFPNPASAFVNVQLTLTENTDVRVELVDMNGRVVISENAGNVKQMNYQLNTSTVANGVYVLRLAGSKLNIKKSVTITK
jgi:hypothetical protein